MSDDKIAHLIPAQPGTYVIHSGVDEKGEFWTSRTNVVAWANIQDDEHLALEPVTADGVGDDVSHVLPILHPDGRIDIPLDRMFENEADWKVWAETKARSELK